VSLRFLILFFLLVELTFFMGKAGAQDLNYTHYTTESGVQLPSNEVYGILFDKNNVLWATTDRGVWRYDGYNSRQFTVTDGLKENTNFRIFTDANGNILVSSINNHLYQISGDKITRHPFSDSINKIQIPNGFVQQINVFPDSTLYLSFNRLGLFAFKKEEPVKQVVEQRKNHNGASMAIHYFQSEYFWDMITMPDTAGYVDTKVVRDKDWIYLTTSVSNYRNDFRKDLCPITENEFLFSYCNKVFHIKNGELITEQSYPTDVIDVYADKSGNFWIGLEEQGVFRYLNGSLKTKPHRYLRGESVTSIIQDHEGSYWFSTLANGIFQANTLGIGIYGNITTNNKDNVITAIVSDGKDLYLGTQTGLLLKGQELLNQSYDFHPIKLPNQKGPINKLFLTPEKHLIVYSNILMEIDTLGHPCGIKSINSYAYDYIRRPNGEWLASFTNEIRAIYKNKVLRVWNKDKIQKEYPNDHAFANAVNRVRAMFLDSKGTLWIGSQKSGLFSNVGTSVYTWSKKDTLFGKRIHDIIEAGDNIWVSIADYGLAVIRPDSSFIRITQKNDKLSSDIINVLYSENDSVVWAGTNNGLNRILLNKGSRKADKISYYTMREGLPSNRIYDIIDHKGNIWISTTQGVVRLDPDFMKPPGISPILNLGPILVNGIPKQPADSIFLRSLENDLVIPFIVANYRKPSTLRYRYQLSGIDKNFIYADNLEARYPDLSSGSYLFRVNATYNGKWDPKSERQIFFHIAKKWYETGVAWTVIALAGLALLLVIFLIILKTLKQREEEKRQLLNAEKRSLLSQMNPHFIFNSLNSIQHFIIQNDEVQANNYLTNFSGLIRRILDNSKKNLIPLNEEISTLTLYLSMEKLRFENEFEYQIIKDKNLDFFETMIPPMLLQPFVENAIWHGLMPLKSKGSLIVSFLAMGDYFQCRIEDNGIGREKSSLVKNKKDPHTSLGIQNIKERIDLLNKLNKKKIILTFTDIRKPDGSTGGTCVELVLPVDLKV
jgi:ligand-binding sensor domain-containing protein